MINIKITIEAVSDKTIELIRDRSAIFYQWVDIDSKCLPMSISAVDNTINIYITDGYSKFIAEFFSDLLLNTLSDSGKNRMAENIAKEFRMKSCEYLMSSILL